MGEMRDESGKQVEVLERSTAFAGFFTLERYRLRHTLFQGGMSAPLVRELLARGQAVAVLLFDPRLDRVVLVEQFRIGALHRSDGPWLLEVVAGIVESGEMPDRVARRETLEEAGCHLQALLPIVEYYASPGASSETVSLYCGIVDASRAGGVHGLAGEGEDIRVEVLPYAQALRAVREGRAANATTIIALQWLQLNRRRLCKEYV
jgi:ADP-ribose pyrophosphatase